MIDNIFFGWMVCNIVGGMGLLVGYRIDGSVCMKVYFYSDNLL